jgi:hypothetical protein
MIPTVEQLAAKGYAVRRVNVEQDREVTQRFRISTIPCFVMIVNGQEADRVVGMTSLGRLEQLCSLGRPAASNPNNMLAVPAANPAPTGYSPYATAPPPSYGYPSGVPDLRAPGFPPAAPGGVAANPAFGAAVTVSDVIAMSGAKVGDALIINQIKCHGMAAPLRPADVIALHQHGVSPDLISLMQTAVAKEELSGPARAQEAIYTSENLRLIQDDWERLWMLDQPDAMTPYRTHGGLLCDPAAPDGKSSSSDQCKRVLDRLRQLGSTDEVLDICGDEKGKYRFRCKVSVGGDPQVTKPFCCVDNDPVKAETAVLKQVEDWQREIQGGNAMQPGPDAHTGEPAKAQDHPTPRNDPQNDELRRMQEEWERFWLLDQPDHMTPYRTHGGMI